MSSDTILENWSSLNWAVGLLGGMNDEQPESKQIGNHPAKQDEDPASETLAPVFHHFQELPAELRIKIWALSANSQPKTIEVQWLSTEFRYIDIEREIPSLLLTCRESRFEALHYYTKCAEHKEDKSQYLRGFSTSISRRRIYINFLVDIFTFQNSKLIGRASHRVAFPPPGRLNFENSTITRIQNLSYDIGPFLKPLKALLDVQEPETTMSIVFKGRPGTPDTTRSELLLGLHIRVLPTYAQKLPNAKLVYQASNGAQYRLTGNPLQVKHFLRRQTSF